MEAVSEAVADLVQGVSAAEAGRNRHAILGQLGLLVLLVVVAIGAVLPTIRAIVIQPPAQAGQRQSSASAVSVSVSISISHQRQCQCPP